MKTLMPCPIYYPTVDAVLKSWINEVNVRNTRKVIVEALLDDTGSGWESKGRGGGGQGRVSRTETGS